MTDIPKQIFDHVADARDPNEAKLAATSYTAENGHRLLVIITNAVGGDVVIGGIAEAALRAEEKGRAEHAEMYAQLAQQLTLAQTTLEPTDKPTAPIDPRHLH